MMTVREAFSKAFGEVPEGATCHIGNRSEYDDCEHIEPTVCGSNGLIAETWNGELKEWTQIIYFDGSDANDVKYDTPFGPDISDRPAESFRGFFGDAYDRVLEAQNED